MLLYAADEEPTVEELKAQLLYQVRSSCAVTKKRPTLCTKVFDKLEKQGKLENFIYRFIRSESGICDDYDGFKKPSTKKVSAKVIKSR